MQHEQVLVRCEEIWCAAQDDGTVRTCPYRVKLDGFRYPLCKLFSTPGPHSDSKIAKVLGGPMVRVHNIVESAEWKLRAKLVDDDPGGRRRRCDDEVAQEVA